MSRGTTPGGAAARGEAGGSGSAGDESSSRAGHETSARRVSPTARLVRLGFVDTTRAARLLASADLQAVLGDRADDVLGALGESADPDLALLQLVRLAEAVGGDAPGGEGAGNRAPGGDGSLRPFLIEILAGSAGSADAGPGRDGRPQAPTARRRLLAVLGASVALGDEIVRRPGLLRVVADPTSGTGVDAADVRAELLRAVGADPAADAPVAAMASPAGSDAAMASPTGPGASASSEPRAAVDALRRAYRERLLRIAATDLTVPDPLSQLPAVAAALADLAAAALEAALAVARAGQPDHGRAARLAVIAMGKCGGRELNYVSDVDVIYVVEPGPGADEAQATAAGTRLATAMARICAGTAGEPPLWPLDAALRPEGKRGALVRTQAGHISYYERWAKTWEFQALLKARTVAGDRAVGRAYEEAIGPFVWSAVGRENFVEDSRAMRRRVEEHVPRAEADRQLKLGRGGLRDVEFTVQLLQLVHGRADETIRDRDTLTAVAQLSAGGYIAREHAARLAVCYRFLRSLEHRIQLHRLRRTHLMPVAEADLRRLARSLGMRAEGAQGLLERWRGTRREVRSLHEALFYRPLLPATAQLSPAEVSLAPEVAAARFAAIGYLDPEGATRHVLALTEGLSRRAAIQRHLLPVMLGWFAEGASPDDGLAAFRRLSDELGTTHWYLKLLRDSGSAAARLAHVLSNSRYAAAALARSPESVTWLDDDADLAPRGAERLAAESDAILARAEETPERAVVSLRALRRRELARTAVAELLGVSDPVQAAGAISDAADVLLAGGLRLARRVVKAELGRNPAAPGPAKVAVIAMGRLGGRELGYGSDADVLFVFDPAPGADEREAHGYALAVATRLRSLLGAVGPEPGLPVDANLRPEGRSGPLVRSLASYAEYYGRWAAVWESQALLRARPVAGDAALGERFVALIDPLRYPAAGLDAAAVREVRRIKARVESERLPRGVDPSRHLKLGRGGVSDVEWVVQLLQLQHAGTLPELRTTATMTALDAATAAGLVDERDAATLSAAWRLASRVRSAVVLWSGRAGGTSADLLPADRRALRGLARVLDLPGVATGSDLEEHYLRTARRARATMERLFYG